MLAKRFHNFGDIQDIVKADSTVRVINAELKGNDMGPNMSLAGYSITRHKFIEAYDYVKQLKKLGGQKYAVSLLSFDVDFELGNYYSPAVVLKSIEHNQDYGYYFRLSKFQHLKGDMEGAIGSMKKATELAESNTALKLAAMSNTADLYIHSGDLKNAYQLYVDCIRLNGSDFHSMMGMGWIALVNDKKDSLAERIYQFVHEHYHSPDPLFKLYQVAQFRGDSINEVKYASQFVQQVSDTLYGGMYNKYLVELYTGILHNPAKAMQLAKEELNNRATPQTKAWYVWTMYCNNQPQEAYNYYRHVVSGKPLEGLELYYMGKMMQGLNKGYNAQEFFKAAYKNRYDLSPAMMKFLESNH
jgi:tetratricopeptide (TPR) repeat protein